MTIATQIHLRARRKPSIREEYERLYVTGMRPWSEVPSLHWQASALRDKFTAMEEPRNSFITTVISLAALVGIWFIAAILTDDASVLPQPLAVAQIAFVELFDGPMMHHVLATLRRVAFAFTIALVIGILIGIALGKSARANRWFGPWVSVFLNVPALVVIVLCYLWIGLNEVAAIVAVATNKTAMVAVNIREGIKSLDPDLGELSQSYRFSTRNKLLHIWLPQLWPYLAATMRNGLAIIWKIVLVVEFLGRSDGVGFQIHLYFQLFETGYVLAYSLSFVAVMLTIELILLQPLERRAEAWRTRDTTIS